MKLNFPFQLSLFMILFCMIIEGCSLAKLRSDRLREQIVTGKTVVVFRVTPVYDGVPYPAFPGGLSPLDGMDPVDGNFGMSISSLRSSGDPQLTFPVAISEQTREEGWAYIVLEPGRYYLSFYPPRYSNLVSYMWGLKNRTNLWQIDIPAQTECIYIGRLVVPIKLRKVLFAKYASFIEEDMSVLNEKDMARKITKDFLPYVTNFNTSIMKPHKGPLIFEVSD